MPMPVIIKYAQWRLMSNQYIRIIGYDRKIFFVFSGHVIVYEHRHTIKFYVFNVDT